MTPEAKTKALVKKALTAAGVYYFMPVSNGMGVMGVFDFVACVDSVFLGIECKADRTKHPTILQTRQAKLAQSAGGVVFLAHCDNITALADTINLIKASKHGLKELSFWPFDLPEANG
jgi:hypothetical protein